MIDTEYEGCVLAEPIFSSSGAKILNEGVRLTIPIISKLKNSGIEIATIDVKDIENVNSEISLSLKLKLSKELKRSFELVSKNGDMDIVTLKTVVEELIENALRKKETLRFSRFNKFDDDFTLHSLNVGILALFTGLKLGYNSDRLTSLTLGALLHDVGEIINPEDHCKEGFDFLKKYPQISATTYVIALQHHIPLFTNGQKSNCHEYSKIVSVCSSFDESIVRNNSDITEATKEVISKIGTEFESEIVKTLLYSLSPKK